VPDQQPSLKVHSLNVQHSVAPDGKGGMAVVKKLTYHVGDHGPFFHQYEGDTGTTAKMKSDIGAQVSELQELHTVTG
jgi:hypothetical protein